MSKILSGVYPLEQALKKSAISDSRRRSKCPLGFLATKGSIKGKPAASNLIVSGNSERGFREAPFQKKNASPRLKDTRPPFFFSPENYF